MQGLWGMGQAVQEVYIKAVQGLRATAEGSGAMEGGKRGSIMANQSRKGQGRAVQT